MSAFASVLITGASGGIGRALALAFAGPNVSLAIVGRDTDALAATAAQARERGARVLEGLFDVRDTAALQRFVDVADQTRALDLVIANAGVSAGLEPGYPRERPADARRLIDVNLSAALATVEPAIDAMILRRSGRIAFMGSIAALLPLPYAPSYSATKAAVHTLAGALRPNLRAHGVGVSLIVPGFVTSAMSARVEAWKPFEIPADKAAGIIRRGLEAGRDEVVFPRLLAAGAVAAAHLPRGLREALFSRVPARIRDDREAAG